LEGASLPQVGEHAGGPVVKDVDVELAGAPLGQELGDQPPDPDERASYLADRGVPTSLAREREVSVGNVLQESVERDPFGSRIVLRA